MAWQSRAGTKNRYYYRRIPGADGRAIRHYVGRGPLAEQAAAEDAERRAARHRHQRQLQACQEQLCRPDETAMCFEQAVRRLLAARLLGAGYHLVDRARWRKRGGNGSRGN